MSFLDAAVGDSERDVRGSAKIPPSAWKDGLWVGLTLALVVVSSVGAVRFAVSLAVRLGVHQAVIGTLVLAGLTSVPNVIAAVRLARQGRGEAVLSESLNSNTINILVGICLPALLIGFAPPSNRIIFAALWLLVMKLMTLALASRRHGLRRLSGAALVLTYLVFATVIIFWK